jgi:predicted permease
MRILYHCLVALADRPLADSIIGDLEEQRRTRGARWFCRSALGILLHLLGQKVRGALVNGRASRGGTSGAGGDFRQAFRTLRRSPVFFSAAILLFALGIGANTAVFSVVQAVLLQPLPYAEPDRLVHVWRGEAASVSRPGHRHSILTWRDVGYMARDAVTFDGIAAIKSWDTGVAGRIDVLDPSGASRLRGAHVTTNFFELLGVNAALGRVMTSLDDPSTPIAVISHDAWRTHFASDPAIVGRQVTIAAGRAARSQPPVTIVGVLPTGMHFTYPRETEIYLPAPWRPARSEGSLEYIAVARLKEGVTLDVARQQMTALAKNISRSFNFTQEAIDKATMEVEPLPHHMQAEVRPGVALLAGVAGLVLVIACVNLGLMILSRTVDRQAELSVRAALGAGPRRIIRLLAVEGLVLAAVGGITGAAIATLAQPSIRALMPPIVPRAEDIRINGMVLLFATVSTLVTALLSAVLPAMLAMRRDLFAAVRRAGSTAISDRTVMASRRLVIAVQVSVVLLLVVGAALMLQSFWRMHQTPLGFNGDGVLTMEMQLLNPIYRRPGRLAQFERDLMTRVRQIPGVELASLSTSVPMRGQDYDRGIVVDGEEKMGHIRSVDPDYFSLLQVQLKRGRLFTRDDERGAPVVIVSEEYGRMLFGARDPLGQRVKIDEGKVAEIVGVVNDVRYQEVVRDPAPAYYLPRSHWPTDLMCVLVRPRPGMESSVASSLRTVVGAMDPQQPAGGLTTIDAIVRESTADRRLYAVVTGSFAVVAILLTMGGLFGMVSRAVSERRRELAIRVALGADARRVVRLILAYGLVPVALGAIVGLAGAFAASGVLRRFLFGVAPTDPPTYAAAFALILVVAVAACLLPARRALRFEPASLLRE